MRQRRKKENACWRLLCCLCNSIIEAEKGERSPPRSPQRIVKRPSKPQQAQPSFIRPSPILDDFRPPLVDRPPTNFSANGPQEQYAQPNFFGPTPKLDDFGPLDTGRLILPMHPPSVQDFEEDMRPRVFSGNEPSERPNVNMRDANGPIILPMLPPIVQDSPADTRPATYLGNGPGALFAGPSERPEVVHGGAPSYSGHFIPRFRPPDVD